MLITAGTYTVCNAILDWYKLVPRRGVAWRVVMPFVCDRLQPTCLLDSHLHRHGRSEGVSRV